MSQQPQSLPRRARVIVSIGLAGLLLASAATYGQDTVEWTTLGNDFAHTRYSPADQISADNFDQLEVGWFQLSGTEWSLHAKLYQRSHVYRGRSPQARDRHRPEDR